MPLFQDDLALGLTLLLLGVVLSGVALSYRFVRAQSAEIPNADWHGLIDRRAEIGLRLQEAAKSFKDEPPTELLPAPAPDDEAWPAVMKAYAARKDEQLLEAAEEAMAARPADAEPHLMLSLALLCNGDIDAAASEHAKAAELGAAGALFDVTACFIEIDEYLQVLARGKDPTELLSPIELLALEMHVRLGESNDAAALWTPGVNGGLSQEQGRELVVTHFHFYYGMIDRLLDILDRSSFADGVYWVGRLAIKCGFGSEGLDLFTAVAPAMESSRQRRQLERDMATLRGEKPITEKATEPASGKKIIKLKVLN